MLLLEDKRFYVYVYLDIRYSGNFNYDEFMFNFLPFYVGKGKDNRKEDHFYRTFSLNYKGHRFGRIRKIYENTNKLLYMLEKV